MFEFKINKFKNLKNKSTIGILFLSIICSLFTFISSFWFPTLDQSQDYQNTQRLFVLTPNSLIFQPFNLVLSSLVHISIPVGALFLTIFYYASSYFEQQWGNRELIKHFLVVNIITNLLVCFILIFKFAVTGSSDILFTKIYGLGPFISALLVAYKRAIPEHSITTFQPFFSLRVKYIPSINIAIHFFFFLMGWISTLFYLVTIGSIVSWVYIRYYKYHDGIMGDRSETFSFASFFPDSFIGVIKPISTIVYTTLVNVKLLPPLPPKRPPQTLQSLEEGNDKTIEQQEPVPRPITEETIFETHIQSEKARRKELAERALAERLQQKKSKS